MNQASKVVLVAVSVVLGLVAVGVLVLRLAPVKDAPMTSVVDAPPASLSGQLAVFHLPKPSKKPASVSGKPEFVKLRVLSTEEYVVPAPTQIDSGRGMDDDAKEALRASAEVTVLDLDLGKDAADRFHRAESFALALAEQTGGAVWDEESQEVMAVKWFKENRVEDWNDGIPSAATHIMIFAEELADGTLSLTTAGLSHFDLPELQANGMGKAGLSSVNSMINALAQQLVEHPEQAKPGRVTLSLPELKHPGVKLWQLELCMDNAEQKLELTLARSGKAGQLKVELDGEGAPAERFQRAITVLYGSADTVTHQDHDEELLEVSKKALAVLKKKVKPRFDKGLKLGEMLLVKAPFKTSAGGNEWMWVEVQSWKRNGEITGLLDNDPDDVPELTSGSKVTVKESELFDWTMHETDGGWSGNTTGEVMLARQKNGKD